MFGYDKGYDVPDKGDKLYDVASVNIAIPIKKYIQCVRV